MTFYTQLEPGEAVTHIDGVVVRGREVWVDDLALGTGRLEASYALLPGARVGDALACQTGWDGANGVGAWGRYYYHHNDLGSVIATSDAAGDALGAYAPDFVGNYAVASGARPDALGLGGKNYDEFAGLYYYGARWLDPERGHWMSEEPLGLDGPNGYHYVFGNYSSFFDLYGLFTFSVDLGASAGAAGIGGEIGFSFVASYTAGQGIAGDIQFTYGGGGHAGYSAGIGIGGTLTNADTACSLLGRGGSAGGSLFFYSGNIIFGDGYQGVSASIGKGHL